MREKRGLSGSTLKIIAMISMLTDHAAYVFLMPVLTKGPLVSGSALTAYRFMRNFVGRFAFPIYCFLLVEGFQKTHDRKKYALRLFAFALISEVPFDLAFYNTPLDMGHSNVFFTLFLSFIMMALLERAGLYLRSQWLRFFSVIAVPFVISLCAEIISCDYGAKGIIAVALLYLFRRNKTEQLLAGCVAFVWEITAPLAFIPIAFYNGTRGLKLKYVFYAFYPAHLLLLYLLSCLAG